MASHPPPSTSPPPLDQHILPLPDQYTPPPPSSSGPPPGQLSSTVNAPSHIPPPLSDTSKEDQFVACGPQNPKIEAFREYASLYPRFLTNEDDDYYVGGILLGVDPPPSKSRGFALYLEKKLAGNVFRSVDQEDEPIPIVQSQRNYRQEQAPGQVLNQKQIGIDWKNATDEVKNLIDKWREAAFEAREAAFAARGEAFAAPGAHEDGQRYDKAVEAQEKHHPGQEETHAKGTAIGVELNKLVLSKLLSEEEAGVFGSCVDAFTGGVFMGLGLPGPRAVLVKNRLLMWKKQEENFKSSQLARGPTKLQPLY